MTTKHPPIAIIGMASLFPKAPTLSAYWRNILDAADCISDVPAEHSWDAREHYSDDPAAKDKTWCTRGGFLDAIDFDPVEFGIPPNMLESIDTTQLLSLIVAREALKDAGLDPEGTGWDRERVACILGITGTQEMAINLGARLFGPIWRKALRRCGVDDTVADAVVQDIGAHLPTWTEQSFPGLLGNVVTGRISNRFDLGGTNAVVDAACASSLAAMQYALSELTSGRSDVVLTGGADCLNDAFMYQCFTRTPAFTKQGVARPFDVESDGILIGEGIAMVACKRLEDAERDGDRIYAVIRGLGSSSDGRFKSIYAPNPAGQAKCLRRAYEMADVDPGTVELIEAHGTGTRAGDAAEIEGLKQVFGAVPRDDRWIQLGSVKSQIGHTKSTAGAAGLVKAVLALHHRVLPPTAKVDAPNPKMGFEDSPFFLSPHARPWIRAKDHKRRAGVSAFGFGGTNYHCVLEEYGDDASFAHLEPARGELFVFEGRDAAGVRTALDALDRGAPSLAHTARAALDAFTGRQPHVLAFATDAAGLDGKLAAARDLLAKGPGSRADVHYGVRGQPAKLAYVFPGQGSQYVEMGRDLAVRWPIVRQAFDAADEHFRVAGRAALSKSIFPPPYGDADADEARLRATDRAQPAIGALSRGMLDLLGQFGLRPDAVAGHSYGELVALYAAGALDADGLMAASRLRGEHMAAGSGDRGTMAAVGGDLTAIAPLLAGTGVVLANRNHPEQGVISGPTQAVDDAVRMLVSRGFQAKRIPVGAAFHSPLVADAAGPFARALDGIDLRAPRIPVISTATAAPYPSDARQARALLADQLTRPVDWIGVVERLYALGARVFVEVGPKGVLTTMVRKILAGRDPVTVVSLDRRQHEVDGDLQLKGALAQLLAAGVAVDLAPLRAFALPQLAPVGKSRATVGLTGANYRNESTKHPPLTDAVRAAADRSRAVAAPSGPVPSPAPAASPTPVSVPAEPVARSPMSPMSDELAELLAATQETLRAFQATQERAAALHGDWLRTHADANAGFSRLFETQARLVELAATGAPLRQVDLPARPSVALALDASARDLGPLAARPSPLADEPMNGVMSTEAAALVGSFLGQGRKTPATTSLPGLGAAVAASADLPPLLDARGRPIADARSAQPARHAAPPAPALAAPAPSPTRSPIAAAPSATRSPVAAASSAARSVIDDAMFAVVAEKTGYPRDMLEPAMDLESDLGIDSIKRVEILAAVQDRVPGLPELDNDRLSALRTLAEVTAYLAERAGHGAPAQPAPPASRVANGASAPAASFAPASAARSAIDDAMFDVVAEKTGYPRDMLEPAMDLESDLGIDSIKRVEILAAVQDRVPGLPELDNDRLSALRTLAEVTAYLAEQAGHASPPAPVAHEATRAPVAPSASAGAARTAIDDAMFDVVAEKTGYPRDMLEPAMDLESDLGIDSIKRVEILAAVQDRVPGLPELDNDRLSALRTLAEVTAYLAEQAGHGAPAQPVVHETTRAPVAHAPVAPPASAGAARTAIDDAMFDVVAEKTGYPRDMLEPAMDLESDLGIDSIKRVEILAAVQDRVPGLPELDNDRLSALRTLAEVTAYLAEQAGHAAPAPARAPTATSPSATAPAQALLRKVVRIVPCGPGVRAVPAGRILVTADKGRRSTALVSALKARGVDAHRIDPDWSAPLALGPCDGVVHLAALGTSGDDLEERVRGAFALAKATGELRFFATVSELGGDFGLARCDRPLQGGLAGLPKTLAQEWTGRFVAVDLHPDAGMDRLADALIHDFGSLEIAVRPDGVHRLHNAVAPMPELPAGAPCAPGDLVVVSGGARGVTAAVVIEMARRWKPELLLLGRSELPASDPAWARGVPDDGLRDAWLADARRRGEKPSPKALDGAVGQVLAAREVRATLDAIRAAGTRATYASVDIRDAEAVSAVVRVHRRPVVGIVHGAGVLADKRLLDKTPEQFDRVFGTKVDGLDALLGATDQHLRFAVMFASVAGRYGNIGQCDYAMGNEVLTHTALQLAQRGVRAKSFDWGPWEAGMVTPALRKQFEARGLTVIPLDAGAAFCCDELERGGDAVEVVVEGPRPETGSLTRTLTLAEHPWLADHAIDGAPVVPVAMVLEWFADAARQVHPGLRVEAVEDLSVLKGIVVDGLTPLTLSWSPVPAAAGARALAFELATAGRPHYRAVVRMSASAPAADRFPGSNGLGKQRWTAERYGKWLFHGPAFQGIDEIVGFSDHGIVGKLRSSTPGSLGAGGVEWTTDPLAVDSALQMMLLWVGETQGTRALPCAIKSFRQFKPFTGPIACHLEMTGANARSGRFQATFVDESGDVVARLDAGEYAARRA